MTKRYSDFQTPGSVSVWVGDFRSEDDFDDYLNSQFESDFGFRIDDRAVRELGVESEPASIRQLVHGFSRADTFGDSVVEAAHRVGCASARAMFIIYFFAFDPAQVTVNHKAPLTFVGAVPFTGFK